jgi:mRNA interferase RelE/StbE
MYKVKYHKQVIKFLKSHQDIAKKIILFFDEVKSDLNFQNYDVKKMEGFKNSYRLRISKFRVIFKIENNELLIEVIKAGSRGDVYK